MVWEVVQEDILLPNGRRFEVWSVGSTGRMAVVFPQSDYQDTRLRCLVEFTELVVDLPIEPLVVSSIEVYSKTALVTAPSIDSSIGLVIAFPSRTLPFAGQTFVILREV